MKCRASDSTKRGKKYINVILYPEFVTSALPMKKLKKNLFMHQSVFLSQEDEKSWK